MPQSTAATNNAGKPECTICTNIIGEPRDDGSVESGTLLSCNHVFGTRCLAEYMRTNNRCPMCRGVVHDDIVIALMAQVGSFTGAATGDASMTLADRRRGETWRELDDAEAMLDAATMREDSPLTSARRNAFSAASGEDYFPRSADARSFRPSSVVSSLRASSSRYQSPREGYPGDDNDFDDYFGYTRWPSGRDENRPPLEGIARPGRGTIVNVPTHSIETLRRHHHRRQSHSHLSDAEYLRQQRQTLATRLPEPISRREFDDLRAGRQARQTREEYEDRELFHSFGREASSSSAPLATSRSYNVVIREPSRTPYSPSEAQAIERALVDPDYFTRRRRGGAPSSGNRDIEVIEREMGPYYENRRTSSRRPSTAAPDLRRYDTDRRRGDEGRSIFYRYVQAFLLMDVSLCRADRGGSGDRSGD